MTEQDPGTPQAPQVSPEGRDYSSFAVASLVLGILSILGGFIVIIPAILAVVFGHLAVRDCNRDPRLEGKVMAVVGLVLGWFTLAVGLLVAITAVAFLRALSIQ